MRLRSNRILEGGHTSLQFGRSDDFVDLREYVIGDDVRDIDWKASARSPALVVRRYVAEKAQEFLLVADTGANLLATAPSGERKRDLALLALGAVGLVASAQSDKISVVFGDDRGSSIEPGKTGEDHLEQIATLINNTQIEVGNASNIVRQLEFIAANLDKRYAIYIVCDELARHAGTRRGRDGGPGSQHHPLAAHRGPGRPRSARHRRRSSGCGDRKGLAHTGCPRPSGP